MEDKKEKVRRIREQFFEAVRAREAARNNDEIDDDEWWELCRRCDDLFFELGRARDEAEDWEPHAE